MATFSYFPNYPQCLLDPLLFPIPTSSIDQNLLYSLPNTSEIEDTSLTQFLDSCCVDKIECSVLKKQNNTETTANTNASSSGAKQSTTSNRQKESRSSSNSKEGVEGRKIKKQRKGCSGNVKEKRGEEAPKDYIHLRARRGQATNSHSLAERVRREKISERMKILQNLVPGCNKVTGKALMLDEIINYVQSLQNQVEFLSMKLTSISPMVYDFGMDLDDLLITPEMESTEVGTNAMPSLFDSIIHTQTQTQLQEEGEEKDKFVDKSGFNFNSNSFGSFA